ncbi:hypothetical protein M0805_004295 [Coniferiporia weirii]|nr:hypothetical protein M0805_004295 [Coniferiporia weirii]
MAQHVEHSEAPLQAPGITINPVASSLARDALLVYAHRLFNSPLQPVDPAPAIPVVDPKSAEHPYTTHLLPLLLELRTLHPRHLPTLLLLGCVYHAIGEYSASISQNEEILRIDGAYVEAMSNLGTTLKAMGRDDDALSWWWRAVSLRPAYWDAVNNLFGTLTFDQERVIRAPDVAYRETLKLCEFVQSRLVSGDGKPLVTVPPNELHQLQNTFYVSGSIRGLSGQDFESGGLQDFVTAIEILLQINGAEGVTNCYNIKHLLLSVCIGGLVLSSALPESVATFASSLGYPDPATSSISEGGDVLEFVQATDDALMEILFTEAGGVFPSVFITPEQAVRLSSYVFHASFGVFPSLCSWSAANGRLEQPSEKVKTDSNTMASNVLLGIAKKLQEMQSLMISFPRFDKQLRAGPSLVLLLYYLAFSLSPSPSVCNNLGIILSTTPWPDMPAKSYDQRGGSVVTKLAKLYYEKGLELDNTHPHLLTNMGSLLKETGFLEEAIQVYARVVQLNPDFDVALANLANAIKDSGRLSESIPIYRRAVKINGDLPEALCGLVHAAWSVCDWRGFGRIESGLTIDDVGNLVVNTTDDTSGSYESGWMPKLIHITQMQLSEAYQLNINLVKTTGRMEDWLSWIEGSTNNELSPAQKSRWVAVLREFYSDIGHKRQNINECGFIIRVVEWLMRHLQWRWYNEAFGISIFSQGKLKPLFLEISAETTNKFSRPRLPPSMVLQATPSVLPFHTFIYPFSARQLRLVAHRNAVRISHSTLTRPWLPEHVYPPPPPPYGRINVAYVSSDFTDHPTAHLFGSVPRMHSGRFRAFVYALTASDASTNRKRFEEESEVFRDVSTWSTQRVIEQIIKDEIHILVNLNGYTKGARNDIFAARPCPLQISFLGFAGTLAAGWCDYLVCDPIVCPPSTRVCEICESRAPGREGSATADFDLGPDPESTDDWKYAERLIYMPHSYLVTDHKQTYGENSVLTPEQRWKQAETKRRRLRRILFQDIFEDTIIFANFNQFTKSVYATWLRVLKRVPNSILWLLRFPPAGEEHLLRTARQWAGSEIAARVRFTDVARKDDHVERAAIADIFLDTVECNAHTVAADVLWGGTPIITWPKYAFKMCSRVGASIAYATGFGKQMVVDSLPAYEERVVSLAMSATPSSFRRTGPDAIQTQGELGVLRKALFMNRDQMPLFDTLRWTRNLEKGYEEAWRRWVQGGTTLHFNIEGARHRYENCNSFIWIRDNET